MPWVNSRPGLSRKVMPLQRMRQWSPGVTQIWKSFSYLLSSHKMYPKWHNSGLWIATLVGVTVFISNPKWGWCQLKCTQMNEVNHVGHFTGQYQNKTDDRRFKRDPFLSKKIESEIKNETITSWRSQKRTPNLEKWHRHRMFKIGPFYTILIN